MKLRRCSLRKMIDNGQVDERIKQKVLNGLKDIVITSGLHGDLKDWGKAKRALPWTLSDNQPIRIYSIFVYVNFQTSPTTCSSISILSMGVSTISKWSLQIGERRVKIRNILAALRCTRQEPRFTIITTKISSHSAVLRWSFIWTSQERDLKSLKTFDQVFDFFIIFGKFGLQWLLTQLKMKASWDNWERCCHHLCKMLESAVSIIDSIPVKGNALWMTLSTRHHLQYTISSLIDWIAWWIEPRMKRSIWNIMHYAGWISGAFYVFFIK